MTPRSPSRGKRKLPAALQSLPFSRELLFSFAAGAIVGVLATYMPGRTRSEPSSGNTALLRASTKAPPQAKSLSSAVSPQEIPLTQGGALTFESKRAAELHSFLLRFQSRKMNVEEFQRFKQMIRKDSAAYLKEVTALLRELPPSRDADRQLLVQLVPSLNVPYALKMKTLSDEVLQLDRSSTEGDVLRTSSLVALDTLARVSQDPDQLRRTVIQTLARLEGDSPSRKLLLDRFAAIDPQGEFYVRSRLGSRSALKKAAAEIAKLDDARDVTHPLAGGSP